MGNELKTENHINGEKSCNNIMLWGLLLRLAVLVFMLTIAMDFTEPYLVKDDVKYDLFSADCANMYET